MRDTSAFRIRVSCTFLVQRVWRVTARGRGRYLELRIESSSSVCSWERCILRRFRAGGEEVESSPAVYGQATGCFTWHPEIDALDCSRTPNLHLCNLRQLAGLALLVLLQGTDAQTVQILMFLCEQKCRYRKRADKQRESLSGSKMK